MSPVCRRTHNLRVMDPAYRQPTSPSRCVVMSRQSTPHICRWFLNLNDDGTASIRHTPGCPRPCPLLIACRLLIPPLGCCLLQNAPLTIVTHVPSHTTSGRRTPHTDDPHRPQDVSSCCGNPLLTSVVGSSTSTTTPQPPDRSDRDYALSSSRIGSSSLPSDVALSTRSSSLSPTCRHTQSERQTPHTDDPYRPPDVLSLLWQSTPCLYRLFLNPNDDDRSAPPPTRPRSQRPCSLLIAHWLLIPPLRRRPLTALLIVVPRVQSHTTVGYFIRTRNENK